MFSNVQTTFLTATFRMLSSKVHDPVVKGELQRKRGCGFFSSLFCFFRVCNEGRSVRQAVCLNNNLIFFHQVFSTSFFMGTWNTSRIMTSEGKETEAWLSKMVGLFYSDFKLCFVFLIPT